jgi:hypothetical protein
VKSPQDLIDDLIAEINALVTGGTLAENKANPLITKLEGVADKLDASQIGTACDQLGAFINQVNAYTSNGTLTAAQGQELIDGANAVKASIPCPGTVCNPNLCQNGGTCQPNGGSYTCTCPSGWTGTNCEVPQATCPCNTPAFPGFSGTVAGTISINYCYDSNLDIYGYEDGVLLDAGSYLVNSGLATGQWYCGDSGASQTPITPEQGQFCAQLLEQAAANQAVTCGSPI